MSAPVERQPSSEGRIRAFDLAGGLAVLFMLLIHVLGHYGNAATWSTPIGLVITFLGGPLAAPVFMVLMGASLAFSTRSSSGAIARRGLWLLTLAYTLNVLRGYLPASLGLATGVVTADGIEPYSPDILLALVDIHQLAGVSLLAIAALPVVRARPVIAVGLAVGCSVVAPLLWGWTSGIGPLDAVLQVVWGGEWYVFFPVFPWIAYPLAGLAYGTLLVRSTDRRAFVRHTGVVGAAIGVAGLVALLLLDPVASVEDYWRQTAPTTTAIIGLGLAWLAACDVVITRLPENRATVVVFGWSARVTSMYCIHWILIAWGVGLVGHRQLDLAALLVAMGLIVVLTHWITLAHPRLRGSSARRPVAPDLASSATALTRAEGASG